MTLLYFRVGVNSEVRCDANIESEKSSTIYFGRD